MPAVLLAEVGKGSTNRFAMFWMGLGRGVVAYGDATNSDQANQSTTALNILWGFDTSQNRSVPLWNFDLEDLVPSPAQVARAYIRLYPVGKAAFGGYTFPSAGLAVPAHEIEGAVGTGIAWTDRMTGTPWNGGHGPRPGYDFDSEELGQGLITSAMWASITGSLGSSTVVESRYIDVPVSDAVQRALDGRYPLRVLLPVLGPGPGGQVQVAFANPELTTLQNGLHSFLVIEYWPALGFLGSDLTRTNRPPLYTNLHDSALAGTSNRTYLDAVEQGTVGDPLKIWAWNFRRKGKRANVVVGTGRAEATTVVPTTATGGAGTVSGITLRSVDVYDNNDPATPAAFTPGGDWTIEAMSGTTYRVGYTPPGGTITYLAEEGTATVNVTLAADHIFLYDSKRALKIRTAKWSATTGADTSDRWTFSTRADERVSGQSTETLRIVEVMPPTSAKGDTPDTATARKLIFAYTQQLHADALDRNISATTHTHLPVKDTGTTEWGAAGDKLDLVLNDGTVLVVTIEEVAPSGFPDEIRLSSQLSAPDLAKATTAAYVTGGLAMGDFPAFQVRVVAPVSVGSTVNQAGQKFIALDSAFTGTPDFVYLVDTSVTPNVSELVEIDAQSGATLQAATNLVNSYTPGSKVFLDVDPVAFPTLVSGGPFFVRANVPAGTAEGLYQNEYRQFEMTTA